MAYSDQILDPPPARSRDQLLTAHRQRINELAAQARRDPRRVLDRSCQISEWLQRQLRSLAHLPAGEHDYLHDPSTVLVQDMLHQQTEILREWMDRHG